MSCGVGWSNAASEAHGWFSQSSSFINMVDSYCNTIDMAYSNYSTDGIPRHGYLEINVKQFNLLSSLTQNQIHMKYTLNFPILPHHPPSIPRSLSKSNPADGFAFA